MTSQQETANRMNDLAVESTQTLIDAAYLAQRQSVQLLQAWLNTLDGQQAQQRDLASKLVRQSQEAQNLLAQYVQDQMRSGVDTFTRSTQQATSAVTNATQQAAGAVNSATQQAGSAAKNNAK